MKARYSYPLLFLLPSAMLALLAAVAVVAVGAGVLWIFVFGDDPWPASANTVLMAMAVTASALAFVTLIALSYSFGKSREIQGGLCRSHVVFAVAVSVGLPLLVLLHQWQVGNIGSKPVPAKFR